MKAMGMVAIVWGHGFPKGGMDSFLYAFNVPVFFWVSGYLCHREENMRVCWQKCWKNLVIPYLILALLKCLGPIIKHLSDGQFVYSLIGIAGGFHTFHGVTGCNMLWFVYTLVLVKLLYQALATSERNAILLMLLGIAGAVVYASYQLEWTWAVTNVMLALPFFMLGNLCSQYHSGPFGQGVAWLQRRPAWLLLVVVILVALAVYGIGLLNDCAYLFQNRYGNNLLLFIAGAVLGILMMILLANVLNDKDWRVTKIISIGSIVILTFHRELLRPLLKIIVKQDFCLPLENLLIFCAAVTVTLAFVPVTLLLKKYFPIVLGTRAKNI